MAMTEKPQLLSEVDYKDYAGVVFAGGWGVLWDLLEDESAIELAR